MNFDLQKASMPKRAAAFLLDLILLIVVASGFTWLIGVITGYDGYQQTVTDAKERIMQELKIDEELLNRLGDPESLTEPERELVNQADALLSADEQASHAYVMAANLIVVMLTFGFMLAYLLLQFAVPLILGNGQTIGKKIFALGVMHLDGVRLGHVALFIRTILGKYAVETMPIVMSLLFVFSSGSFGSPVFLLIAAVLLLVQIILLIASHENALLHDRMAVTAVVDLPSQRIFDTREQLLEFKKKAHAEKAASSVY